MGRPATSSPACRRRLMRPIPARKCNYWWLSSALVMALMVALLGFGSVQAQVSKWVDEKGTVHYGDATPDKYRDSAKAVALRNDAQSPAEAMEAQTRLQSYTESLKAPKSASEPAAPARIAHRSIAS